jgi:hypothetical protein
MELIDLDDHDVFLLRSDTGHAKRAPQSDVGKRGSTKAKDPAGLRVALFRRQFGALGHVFQRNDKSFIPDPHREPLDDGQGQRQADGNGGAFAGCTGYLDRPAQSVNVAPDDIQADSAAGKIGD